MNAAVYKSDPKGTSSILGGRPSYTQWTQHQDIPTMMDAGPQEIWPLPDFEDHLPIHSLAHASLEMKDPQFLPHIAP